MAVVMTDRKSQSEFGSLAVMMLRNLRIMYESILVLTRSKTKVSDMIVDEESPMSNKTDPAQRNMGKPLESLGSNSKKRC